MELYARIMELNSYFVVRLRKDDYKKERSRITSTDSPININLIGERLKKFHDPIWKEKYSKELHLNLRIVYVELPSGESIINQFTTRNHDNRRHLPNLRLQMGNRNTIQHIQKSSRHRELQRNKKNNNRTRHILQILIL